MEVRKVNKIKMSLMESKSDIDDKNKTDYIIKSSGTFVFSQDVYDLMSDDGYTTFKDDDESIFRYIINGMYNELLEKSTADVDSIGVWINYDNKIFENSIKLETLRDMKKFGDENIEPAYEFVKMSILE